MHWPSVPCMTSAQRLPLCLSLPCHGRQYFLLAYLSGGVGYDWRDPTAPDSRSGIPNFCFAYDVLRFDVLRKTPSVYELADMVS